MNKYSNFQILRGTTQKIKESEELLLPGQPLIDLETKELYIGTSANTKIKDSTPITTSNLINGSGEYSVQQKYIENNTDYSAKAIGKNATAFGGKRYNKLTDSDRTPTSAEGNQSFAAGASSHAYGDYAVAMAKDSKSYQAASFTVGGGNQTGRTEAEFNDFYWDSVNNVGLHGGSKDANGNIIDAYGDTYSESYSFGGTFGEVNVNRGRDSIVGGIGNKVDALQSIVAGDRNVSVTGAKHIVAGFNNNVADVNNTVNGDSNTVTGPDNIVGGYKNNVNGLANTINGANNTAEGDYNLIEGQANITASRSSTIVGYANAIGYTRDDNLSNAQKTALEVRDEFVAGAGNTASHGNGGLIGLGLKTGKNEQVVVGTANEGKSDTVFEVGNGSYTQDASGAIHITNRKNAFEVLSDGRAQVQTAPKEEKDIVRLEELHKIEAKLNSNILNDPNKLYIVFDVRFTNNTNTFPSSDDCSLKVPKGCVIDWGDGTVETFAEATLKPTHTYTDGNQYHIISFSNYTTNTSAFNFVLGIKKAVIAYSDTHIADSAFYGCFSLEEVILSTQTSIIYKNAFNQCQKLVSITIPEGIQQIGAGAFSACHRLKKFKILATTPPRITNITEQNKGCFNNTISDKLRIIVPKGSIDAYKTADGWSQYADNIVYEVDSGEVNSLISTATVGKLDTTGGTLSGNLTVNGNLTVSGNITGKVNLYRHDIILAPNAVNQDLAAMEEIHATIYSQSNAKIDTVEKYLNAAGISIVCAGIIGSVSFDEATAFGYIIEDIIYWIYKYDTVFVKSAVISSDNIQNVYDTVTEI